MCVYIAVCTVKNSDNGQRNCPKHVEFYSKNKFEKLVHLVDCIIRIYHDARSAERQNVRRNSLMYKGLGGQGNRIAFWREPFGRK